MHAVTLDLPACPSIRAWAAPDEGATTGIIVLQEIFGANAHIRDVARDLADAGHAALAPDLFGMLSPGVELAYDDEGMTRGRELAGELGFERALIAVQACRDHFSAQGIDRVAVVGFCWGGSLAYLSNTRLGLPAVSYYGARSMPYMGESLKAPMLFHFGGEDASIPPADIERTREAHPHAAVFVYPGAGHAFNRAVDPSHYHADAATVAWSRTLAFFEDTLR